MLTIPKYFPHLGQGIIQLGLVALLASFLGRDIINRSKARVLLPLVGAILF